MLKERLKKIRTLKKMSQEEFGKRLGVTKSTISNIENGRFNITDTMIKLVCSEFNINEDWLRTGNGGDDNIFSQNDRFSDIGQASKSPESFRNFLIKMMENLPDEYCDYLYNEFMKFVIQKDSSNSEQSLTQKTVSELEEEYKKSVLHSASKTKSSVSSITEGINKKANGI